MRTALLALTLSSIVLAQPCIPAFLPGEPGASGINDTFSAYVSPMTPYNGSLVIGGAFSQAGPIATNIIASFDPATETWSRLGGNVNLGNTNGYAAALCTFPINSVTNLILGGSFANVRNGSINVPDTTALAAWNGSQWGSLGTGWAPATGKSVWALLDWQRPGGQHWLVAGGGWDAIGGATADGIAYYDGTWHNIAGPGDTGIGGPFSPVVFAAAVYQGQLFIGGRFATVNGVTAPLVARWTGTAWQRPGTLAAAGSISDVTCFFVWDDGTGEKLYAGGYDMRVGGVATTVAAWNGSVWTRVGQNLGGRTTSLAAFDDGGGSRLHGGWTADAQQHYLYRLESNVWTVAGGGVSVPITGNFPSIFGLRAWDGALYVGGNFQMAGDVPARGIARYGCASAPCSPDVNCDGALNGFDIQATEEAVNGDYSNFCLPSADLNSDGAENGFDIETEEQRVNGAPC